MGDTNPYVIEKLITESALQNRHNLDGYRWDRAIGADQNSRFCVQ